MRGKPAKNLKKVLAIVLAFAMVFCTNSFDNLSRVYAEGGEGENTTSITASSSEEIESSSIEASEETGEDKDRADEPSSEESESGESQTEATEPEDETTATTESSSIESSSETSESEPSESETTESESSESETSESVTSDNKTNESESNTSVVETTEIKESSEVVKEETATISEIEEVNSLATKSELDESVVASGSEIKLDFDKLDAFSQLTYYDEGAAELTGDTIKLLKDIELKNTISFKDNKNLNLAGHSIIGPSDSYALYIGNNFTLFNDGETVGKIEGKTNKYPTIYIKDANVELNGGIIYGASFDANDNGYVENGGDAINVFDSNIKLSGAYIRGGNGEESDSTKGGNGGDAVKVLSAKSNNTIEISGGSLSGGRGANGVGETKPKAGAALIINKMIYDDQYSGKGLPGNLGGGNGGNALKIDAKEFKTTNLSYDEYALSGGHAGYSKVKQKNKATVESNVKLIDEQFALSRYNNDEVIFGTEAWENPTYSLHKLDGKNYLTSFKDQLSTDLCTVFASTAYAETYLIKNHPDYVTGTLGKDVENTYNTTTWNNNPNELNLAEMQFGMGLRVQPKDEFGNAGLSKNKYTESTWAGHGFSESNIVNYATTWRSFVEEDDTLRWTNNGSGSSFVGHPIDRNVLNNYNDKMVVNAKDAIIHSARDFFDGTTFDNDAFVTALKKAVVNYSGAEFLIFTCGRGYRRSGDYTLDGVSYGSNLRIFDAPNQCSKGSLGGHAIYCIGWDDNVQFTTDRDYTGAFICKNSWGDFALVPYQNNFCLDTYDAANPSDGIPDRFMSFITMDFSVASSEYENLYYYDTGISSYALDMDFYSVANAADTYRGYLNYKSVINTFKIRNNKEKVKAVSFALGESGTYKVTLYKVTSLTNGNQIYQSMTDNNKLTETTVNCSQGMNTVPMPEVDLDKGTLVAVKVENVSPGATRFGSPPFDINYGTASSTSCGYETTIANRSFLMNPDTDIYEIVVSGNVYPKGTAEYDSNIDPVYADNFKTLCNNQYKVNTLDDCNLRVRLITNNYVKFNANGFGNYGGSQSTYYYPSLRNAMTNLPYPSDVPSNKRFVKYNTKADKSGVDYNEASIYKLSIAKELELFAIYDDIFTLSFNANGGTGSMDPIRGRYGEVSTLIRVPACQFTRTGFTFAGWIDENGTSFPVNREITLSADKTLRATWKENEYAINYVLNDGEFISDHVKTRKYTQDVDLPDYSVLYKNGFTFDGWFDNEALSGSAITKTNAANTDKVLTYYAKWSAQRGGSGGSTGGGGGGGGGGGIPRQQANNVTKDTKLETAMASVPVSYASTASSWATDAMGNWHLNMTDALGNVVEAKNTFVCLPQEVTNTTGQVNTVLDFYYFDADGKMYTGWLHDANNVTYYFDTTLGNNQGKLTRGWASIDGGYYYFDANGMLMTNGITPDGYTVDSNGKWVQQV